MDWVRTITSNGVRDDSIANSTLAPQYSPKIAYSTKGSTQSDRQQYSRLGYSWLVFIVYSTEGIAPSQIDNSTHV